MDDDQLDKIRALYPRAMTPDPALMKSDHIQPGRLWVPLEGPYAGQMGVEHCATKDFSFVGLMFPGEDQYHVFALEDLKTP